MRVYLHVTYAHMYACMLPQVHAISMKLGYCQGAQSPDGVTNPRSQLFQVKMWKKVGNVKKNTKMREMCEKCGKNSEKMSKMRENV